MGAMGFMGSSMVVDCHIEVGYCHTGGMPMSVHMFCSSSRRAVARIHADGRVEYRTDPMWFTDYMRRSTVEWDQSATRSGGGVSEMSMLKSVDLALRATTFQLRQLEIGTVVYLTGRVFTAREGVYAKAVQSGGSLPASPEDLGSANFHCSPAASMGPDGTTTMGLL